MSQNVPLPRRAIAQAAVASGQTVEDAARAAGVDRRTVHRWLADAEFTDGVRELRRAAVDRLWGEMVAASGEALTALRDAMQPDMAPTLRVRSAQVVLGHLLALHQSIEIDERLEAVEATVREQEQTL